MTTITIILNDKKDKDDKFINKQIIVSHSKEALKNLDYGDALKIAHDITQGTYHKVSLDKFRDDK